MKQLPPGLQHVIAETKLFTDARDYVILRLPRDHDEQARQIIEHCQSYTAFFGKDKDEITLVVPLQVWQPLTPTVDQVEESTDYRLITFDLPVDLELVGYLATLASAVAEVGVSIFSVSMFSRDHFFVPAEDFERAWAVLHDLIRDCQENEAANGI